LKVREAAIAVLSGSAPSAKVVFLVVDDSAGLDLEVDIRLASLSDVTVIRPSRNLGHQGALVYGLRQASPSVPAGDIVVTMDSDGEDRPEDIAALIAPLLRSPQRLDLVAIARRTRRTETPLFRIFYFCFKVFFWIVTGTVVRSGNFVAYRGRLLEEIICHPYFDRCYSASFISLPLNREMVPLPRGRRYAGQSKMGAWGLFTHGLRMLLPFTEKIAIRGVLIFSVLTLLLAGLIFGSRLAANYFHPTPDRFLFAGFSLSLLLLAACALMFAKARRPGRIPAGVRRARG
jgi:glycosyltransferase involved in cell wall biosynthesis